MLRFFTYKSWQNLVTIFEIFYRLGSEQQLIG